MLTEEQKRQIEQQNRTIANNMHSIKRRIVVFSGKGGVGKTTVSVNLAYGLQMNGNRAGILDADVTGPNVPKMLALRGDVHAADGRIAPQQSHGVKVISIAHFLPPDQPVMWRGPMRSKLLHQFLGDVEWGQLDYLVADLPPGTGDEIITLTEKMEPDLAVIVTTPQEVSLIDSARAINMAKKMNVPRIGVIENMSGLICPQCGCNIDLFGAGGGKMQVEKMNVLFLGRLPIDIETRKLSDRGKPVVSENGDADISVAIKGIVGTIEDMLGQKAGDHRQ